MSAPSEDQDASQSGVPNWVLYAGIGVASFVAYKTLFKETKFEQPFSYQELKSDEYTAEYPSSQKYYAVNPWDEIPIRRAKRGPASWKATRVFEVFEKCVKNAPDSVYWLKEYADSDSANSDSAPMSWRSWTRQQVFDLTQQAARAFLACGLKQWQAVCIIGFNSPEWLAADLGALYAGGIVAGIYTTNNPGQCKYIAAHSKAAVAVVENRKQLDKFLDIRAELPELKVIVVWDMDESDPILTSANEESNRQGAAKVMHWKAFMALGADKALDAEIKSRVASIKPGQCCTLIYTSGTTGPPKAVMISHDNVTWESRVVLAMNDAIRKDGSPHATVSYLPLSHIAAQLLDIYFPMAFCAHFPQCKDWKLYFARPTALKGTLAATLKTAQPTLFFGVPRVWEKIQEAIIKKARAAPPSALKLALINWLKDVNLRAYYAKQLGGDMVRPLGLALAERLLTAKVCGGLGLGRLQAAYTGAAPTSTATLEFWGSLGVSITEVYGMSESCGVHTTSLPYYNQQGTVGVPLHGVTTLLQNEPSRDEPGNGEICMRGRHIMMGYMFDEDKTRQAIDDEGYLHSGDVGRLIERYNLLKITGRIKELIITAGGENIAPRPIEDYIKKHAQGVSNAVLIGDRKKYLTLLVTLRCVQDKETMQFGEELDGAAKEVDEAAKTVTQARESEQWKAHIQGAIDKYNADKDYCVSKAQTIKYFRILDGDFGVESGELTATMKLKRPVVVDKYKAQIESMYAAKQK